MDQDAHTHKLIALLPNGPVFEGEDVRALARALAGDPARVDAAFDAHLRDFMPDTCGVTGRYIDDWARVLGLPEAFEEDAWAGYTDAQKQNAIVAKLRYAGRVNIGELQSTFESLFGDSSIVLRHKLYPAFQAGVSGAMSTCGSDWQAVWTLEYMTNVLAFAPDAFESWDNVSGVTDDHAQSPWSLQQTADRLTLDNVTGDIAAGYADFTAAEGDEVHMSIWARTESGSKQFALALIDRDGFLKVGYTVYTLTHTWSKFEYRTTVGAGGNAPRMALLGLTSETPQFLLSGAFAGVRQPGLEQRAQQLAPINTVGVFNCKGENP